MPEPENRKIDDLSKSVKQSPHSKQATGHVVHCLLHVVVQKGPGSFAVPVDFSVRRTVAELRGVKVAKFLDFGLLSPYKTSLQPMGYIAE